RGAHDLYREHGITDQTRTLAYLEPSMFGVLDALRADGPHTYAQRFHLHPSLSEIVADDAGAVVAGAEERPSVVLVAPHADRMRLVHGDDDPPERSWYFPRDREADPTTTVVFETDGVAGRTALPVLLAVYAPGAPAGRPSLELSRTATETRVIARSDERTWVVRLPAPP
ncbi:MAG TPA: heparinase II/III family protein, partial [Sandaracinaceae bacterium LLY-WYZ-13_1]|nr:heparinase II/III family protein [Sandaracinaceae bacterium LLY-WYZ-13_1]